MWEMTDLARLCKLYGYTLIIDPDPQDRPDALGDTFQDRIGKAQLCRNKQIAVQEDHPNATYCVSHELAHGLIGFCDEKAVLAEQANILACWAATLMKEIQQWRETSSSPSSVPQGTATIRAGG
jgi:hypothetical protein